MLGVIAVQLGHVAAGTGASAAGLGARLKPDVVDEAPALAGAQLADFSTSLASPNHQRRSTQHEVGTGLTDVGAIPQLQHQLRLTASPVGQKVSCGLQTLAMAGETFFDAAGHLTDHDGFSLDDIHVFLRSLSSARAGLSEAGRSQEARSTACPASVVLAFGLERRRNSAEDGGWKIRIAIADGQIRQRDDPLQPSIST